MNNTKRLIDAGKVNVRKWFTEPADIQRIQAMLDDTPTVCGITLRELLEVCRPDTDCEVWLDEHLANRYFSVITGTAHALLKRQDVPMLDCRVHSVDAEGGRLVVQLANEEETDETTD